MTELKVFFRPVVYETETKSLKERITESVDDYFYFGGKRIHVKNGAAELRDDPLSTCGKCLSIFRFIFSLFTVVIPVAYLIAKIVLNPRNELTWLYTDPTKNSLTPSQKAKVSKTLCPKSYNWFETQFATKLEKPRLKKFLLSEKDLEACRTILDEVAQLTSDKEKERDFAWGPFRRQCVSYEDLLRLKKDKWLNDTCINTYFEILLAKSKGCLIANSGLILIPPHQKWRPYTVFFENNGRVPTSLLKKTAPIFVPINAGGVHWALLVIHPATKTLTYYDSLSWKPGHEVEKVIENLRKFAELEGITSDISDWKVVSGSCPQQSNGNDCGVFTCMAADRLMQGLPLDYSAKDVPYMRLKMLSEFIRAHGA